MTAPGVTAPAVAAPADPTAPAGAIAASAAAAAAAPPATGFSAVLAERLGEGVTPRAAAAQPWERVTLGEMLGGGTRLAAPSVTAAARPAGGGLAAAAAGSLAPSGSLVPPGGVPPAGVAVLDAASAYLGVPYRWGGTDPATGLDCSGFVQRVFADLGVSVPRVSKDQARAGAPVASLGEARPGDLVYWNGRGGRPNHIGVYLGDGRMVHAPRTGDVVREAPVRSAPPDAIRRIV